MSAPATAPDKAQSLHDYAVALVSTWPAPTPEQLDTIVTLLGGAS